jgi:hypothetical protein
MIPWGERNVLRDPLDFDPGKQLERDYRCARVGLADNKLLEYSHLEA